MGNAASLDIHLLPEAQAERVGKIRYWIEGFIFTHKIYPVSFLSLLLRGAILALDAVPSLTTMTQFRSLIHDTGASRYLHRGTWSRELIPPVFRRAGGANSIHDLLFALEASTPESLTKGILALCHVIQNKLMIEISVLCDFLDTLCKNLVLSQFCSRDGRNLHGITLPRSWLMASIDVDLCSRRNCTFLNLLIRPMAGLLEQIYTGVDADYLLYEALDFSSPVPRAIRAVFITRICRALALLAYNIRSESLKEAVIWTTTSLRRLKVPPPPPSAPYGWYVYADTWGGILNAVRRSSSGSPMDEMVQLLHPTRLTPNTPLHGVAHVRRVVYDRLENVPNLLQSTESRPVMTVAQQSTTLVPEQNGPEEQRPDDRADDDDDVDEDHTFNAAPVSIPVDDEPEIDPHNEDERRILSKLPSIYRNNLWRRKNNGTAMARRRKPIFLSFLLAFEKKPSDKYRKMILGPLPHLLACLEVLNARLLDLKDKNRDRLTKSAFHVDLEELENTLTLTNSAIKKVASLQRFLGPKSGIHITRSEDILKRHVREMGELVSNGLPIGLDTAMREEFEIGWKGIVKPAYVPPAKPEKPKLNTSDCLELAFV
ncbi:hypothetical protein AAF712_004475 [Marasmius tenuissimus]|uniref:Uncharacterized protein n=1 Tax=Marasmius tenuissimus TaxID=585030 RepID=A0ABR3A774_9AGAR